MSVFTPLTAEALEQLANAYVELDTMGLDADLGSISSREANSAAGNNSIFDTASVNSGHLSGVRPLFVRDSDADSYSSYNCSALSCEFYGAEDFEPFRDRVRDLAAAKIWPGSTDPEDLLVERHHSYWYYRALSVTHLPTGEQRFIRTAWQSHDELFKEELDRMKFAEKYTQIPVASVLMSDATGDNPLGCPYYVSERAPGDNLKEINKGLDHETRCQMAKELGQLYRHMLETQFPVPGKIMVTDKGKVVVAPTDAHTITPTIDGLHPSPHASYEAANSGFYPSYVQGQPGEPIASQSVPQAMYSLIGKWITHRISHPHQYVWHHPRMVNDPIGWQRLTQALVFELEQGGHLDNVPFTLQLHHTFEETAILADPSRLKRGENVITAIRDLEGLEFGPAFNQCRPPIWLWDWNNNHNRREGKSLVSIGTALARCKAEAPTDEGREIKAIFDEAAGPVYRRFAYDPVYVIARRAWRFCWEEIPPLADHFVDDARMCLKIYLKMKHVGLI